MTEFMKSLPLATSMTLVITISAFAIGAVLGIPVMLARNSKKIELTLIAHIYVDLLRGLPPIVVLFIIFFGIQFGNFMFSPFSASIVGLGLVSSAYISEIYRSGYISVAAGQSEAAKALGLSRRDIFLRIITPQAFRLCLPALSTYGIGLLKDSALASTVGVIDVLFEANAAAQTSGDGITPFAIAAIDYMVISFALAWLTRNLDYHLKARVS